MTGRRPHGAPPLEVDAARGRWLQLAIVSFAVLLSLSAWLTATALAPELRVRWDLTPSQVGWLTTMVQLGFVVGTAAAAVFNLADILSSRAYFATSALLAASTNALLLVAPGYLSALAARFLTGFFLAGVYPPGMKMVATWFRGARGLAIGVMVGALTVGKGMPYLLKAFGGPVAVSVVAGASVAGVLSAAVVAIAYRDGPFNFPRSPFEWRRVGRIVAHRPTMLATGGYLGHMWELYAFWTWIPAFLAASALARNPARADLALVDLAAFGAIASGALGCVAGGWLADRVGREWWVNLAMAVSGACCLLIGLFFGASFWILVPLTWVWGFFVVADSAQFSAMVTEVAPPDVVGTALTLQVSLGFLLTMVTIQAVPAFVSVAGWPWAFPFLALGPAAGIAAIQRLRR